MPASAPPPRGKVIVMGILFWYPLAGVNYQMLHYMLGLRALGYDVYYVEDNYRTIYDPFSMQVAYVKGTAGDREFLDRHNFHFTFGENFGQPDCLTPATGHNWMPTRQPVHMDLWLNDLPAGDTYNTITTWQNKHEPTE